MTFQIILLIGVVGFCVLTFKWIKKRRFSLALGSIILLGLLLRISVAQTPFLGTWDERFHALVAKNLIDHPLKPTLYDNPILEYDYREWSSNHIWLSKPPLPLWVMAGSMKIFGTNRFALRLPSILMGIMSVWLTFLIGRLLFDDRVGLYAAFFHAIHGMTLEVGGGRLSSDHVETAFLFFYELSLFLMLYAYKKKNIRLRDSLLIGFFCGCAFMCKWIVALFLPIIYVFILFKYKEKFDVFFGAKHISILMISLGLVILPWILFILTTYPEESQYILKAIFIPIGETIQGHGEPWYFFLDKMRIVYGEFIYIPCIWLLYRFLKRKNESVFLLSILIFVPILLLSCMETKRNVYVLLSSIGFFLLTGLFIRYVSVIKNTISINKYLVSFLLFGLVILPVRYSFERVKFFSAFEEERIIDVELKLMKNVINERKNVVVFNEENPIRAMFYLDVTAYSWIPEKEILNEIKENDYVILIKKKSKIIEY